MMKRAIHILFGQALSGFKCYRRCIGGTWYYIGDLEEPGGFAGPVRYWVRKLKHWEEKLVLKVERY